MIKRAETNDLEILAKLAVMMWQNHSVNELINEFSEIMVCSAIYSVPMWQTLVWT